jgi:hypothetical protein
LLVFLLFLLSVVVGVSVGGVGIAVVISLPPSLTCHTFVTSKVVSVLCALHPFTSRLDRYLWNENSDEKILSPGDLKKNKTRMFVQSTE